jgi:Ca-activated chloride channel homolog
MDKTVAILTDEEVRRLAPDREEAGFGCLETGRGRLPLKALDVNARIDGLLAEVDVRQTFVNALEEPLEATYIFPLPDRAAVTRFRMEVGGRVIEGVLRERAAARRDYDEAIKTGHRAAITEEERPGVFTLRVGNIMPGEEATVRLTLAGPLPYSDGEVTFRFPLVVAPRYIPGMPLPGASVGLGVEPDTDAVPDASRITPPVLLPGFPNPVRLSLRVDVASSTLPLGAFRSSLHAVLEETRDGVRHIALKPGERLDRDFILRFRLGEEAVKTSLCLKPDDQDPAQGTFALTLVPPLGTARDQRPRDVAFVLDRSGSMGGWKMVAARRAMARMVDTLTEGDRFAVYAFDDSIETPLECPLGLVTASDRYRSRAVDFLAKIEARGGTEMAQPLDCAVTELARENQERDRILVLVTDGQVGNEDQILRNLGKRIKQIRIFTLGIDTAVNAAFLRRLADLGGGACELVESQNRLEEVMDQVHRRIGTPVLTGLHLEPAGLRFEPDSVVPGRMPDLFTGSPLCIMGRYRGAASGGLTLQAKDASGQPRSESVKASVTDNPALPWVWARGHIRALEDRYVVGHPELEKQIVETSLRFGVLCRFTAFVAVDKSQVVNTGGQAHEITQPVEAPEGWAMLGKGAVPGWMGTCDHDAADSVVSYLHEFTDTELTCSLGAPAAQAMPGSPPDSEPAARRLRDKIYGSSFGKAQAKRRVGKTVPRVDPANYRLRVALMLDGLKKTGAEDLAKRLVELKALADKLAGLIAALQALGVPHADWKVLKKLHSKLEKLLAKKAPKEEVAKLWTECEQVLQALAGDATAGAARVAPARKEFWK